MELKDTVELMVSDDWKKRLQGEYYQVKIRKEALGERLRNMQGKSFTIDDAGEMNLLRRQYAAMNHYQTILLQRIKADLIPIEE